MPLIKTDLGARFMRRFQAQHLLFPEPGGARLKRIPGIAERDISGPVKKLLQMHRNVALAARINTGSGYLVPYAVMADIMSSVGGEAVFVARFGKPRWMEFGTPGCSDYLGLLRDGRMLALEVKGQKYVPSQVSDEQRSFLAVVNECGGLGFVGSDLARIESILSGKNVPEDRGGFLS